MAMELEGATNDRLGATARLRAIPENDWAFGPGASLVMAAFLHPAPAGGRFNDRRLGAWYAALDLQTAVAETVFHHTQRLQASAAGFPALIQMRELLSSPQADLVDVRGQAAARPELYGSADDRGSQSFGEEIRQAGQDGIWFDSVRRSGGENVVIFKPRLLLPVTQGGHVNYAWDANGRSSVARLTNIA